MKSAFVFLMVLIMQPALYSTQGCNWTKENDKHTLGGVWKQNYRTLVRCMDECQKDSKCVEGIDWDHRQNRCSFSTSGDMLSHTGVDHYVCSRCGWTKHRNRHTSGGILKDIYVSRQQCNEECQKDIHCDKGFDWVDGQKLCYFSTSGVMSYLTGVDHYACLGKCRWRIAPAVRSRGSIRQRTLAFWPCVDYCINQGYEECAGVDYVSSLYGGGDRCLLHKKVTAGNMERDHNSIHVAKDCGCTWRYEGKSGQKYSYLKSSNMTLEACKSSCLEQVECQVGIHWDPEENKCYFASDASTSIRDWATSYIRANLDHYLCKF